MAIAIPVNKLTLQQDEAGGRQQVPLFQLSRLL
jgi:hypothetical protein